MNDHTRARGVALALGFASVASLLTGCGTNRRTLVITSDPSGALVYVNDVQMGTTPLEADFTWFGVYEVRLSKPGYEPLVTTGEARPRCTTSPSSTSSRRSPRVRETTVRWHYTLTPSVEDDEALLERARGRRRAGWTRPERALRATRVASRPDRGIDYPAFARNQGIAQEKSL